MTKKIKRLEESSNLLHLAKLDRNSVNLWSRDGEERLVPDEVIRDAWISLTGAVKAQKEGLRIDVPRPLYYVAWEQTEALPEVYLAHEPSPNSGEGKPDGGSVDAPAEEGLLLAALKPLDTAIEVLHSLREFLVALDKGGHVR